MDFPALTRMAFALLAVLGMIGACALVAKRAGLANAGASLKRRRLALIETLPIDARRRAAIIRCDGRDHLVILGPAGETVLASGLEALDAEPAAAEQRPVFADALAQLNKFARNPYAKKRGAA
ncbi:MAG: hypothetical protein GC153_11385 [Alphaproteobacteria bacterium]|nr:hypothetical protein [Alphaproteobacteria bacterium]